MIIISSTLKHNTLFFFRCLYSSRFKYFSSNLQFDPKINYYQKLGISQNASHQQIKSAYHQLAKTLHPDHNQGINSDRFKEITNAYNILSNPDTKTQYDQLRNNPHTHTHTQTQYSNPNAQRYYYQSGPTKYYYYYQQEQTHHDKYYKKSQYKRYYYFYHQKPQTFWQFAKQYEKQTYDYRRARNRTNYANDKRYQSDETQFNFGLFPVINILSLLTFLY